MATITHRVKVATSTDDAMAAIRAYGDQVVWLAATVEKNTNKMSGFPLLKHANDITAAVGKMGNATTKLMTDQHLLAGVAKLTAAEQTKYNAVWTQAYDKLVLAGKGSSELAQRYRMLAGATKQLPEPTKTFASSLSQLNGLLGAFGMALSVGAVVSFARSLLTTGDAIVRVADRTGLTIDQVQRLQYVASQSGNSLDEMTAAIGQMQNRLTEGDASAVAAISKLNLSFDDIRTKNPYEQLRAIAAGMGSIEDPALRTKLAMDLFGRAGAATMPSLIAQFQKLADEAPRMSDETVKALDSAGDALNRLSLTLRVGLAESYNWLRRQFEGLIAGMMLGIAKLFEGAAQIIEFTSKLPGASLAMKALGDQVKWAKDQAQWWTDAAKAMVAPTTQATDAHAKFTPVVVAAGEATKKHAERAKALTKEYLWLRQGTAALGVEFTKLNGTLVAVIPSAGSAGKQFEFLGWQLEPIASKALPSMVETLPTVASGLQRTSQAAQGFGQSLKANLLGVLEQIPSQIANAFTGGGGVMGALKATLTTVGAAIGAAVGFAVGGPIGASIGSAIGSLLGMVTSLFGGGAKKARQMAEEVEALRKSIIDTAGGVEEFERAIALMGLTWADVNKMGKVGLEALKGTLERNKIAVDELSKAGAALTTWIKNMVTDTESFNRAGNYAVAIFAALYQRTGSLTQALAAVGEGLDILAARYKELGQTAPVTVQKLLELRKVTEANKDLMESLDAITVIMRALGNTLSVNSGMAQAFGADLLSIYNTMIERGVESTMALALMQAPLQQLWQMWKANKIQVDASTEALLKQAEVAGVVGSDMKSINEQMLDVLLEIKTAMSDLATAMKNWGAAAATAFESAEQAAQSYGSTVGSLPTPFVEPGAYTVTPHGGGLITPHGVYHEGDVVRQQRARVLPFKKFHAGDEVPAILQTGEFVLRRSAVNKWGVPALREMNAGRAPGGMGGSRTAVSQKTTNISVTFSQPVFLNNRASVKPIVDAIGAELMRRLDAAGERTA